MMTGMFTVCLSVILATFVRTILGDAECLEWKNYNGWYLADYKIGLSNLFVNDINACKRLCETETDFKCLSIDYQAEHPNKVCVETTVTKNESTSSSWTEDSAHFFSERKPCECTEWQDHKGRFLRWYKEALTKANSLEDCKQQCEAKTDYKCVSVDYESTRKGCFMAKVTDELLPSLEMSPTFTYSEHKKVPCCKPWADSPGWSLAGFDLPGGLSYDVNTLEDCKEKCDNEPRCRSIDYNTHDKTCILGSSTRIMAPASRWYHYPDITYSHRNICG